LGIVVVIVFDRRGQAPQLTHTPPNSPTPIDATPGVGSQILNEINVMRHLYHRNVVLLFEVISDPSEDTIFMIMEVRWSDGDNVWCGVVWWWGRDDSFRSLVLACAYACLRACSTGPTHQPTNQPTNQPTK
jgi:hypothetical protein